MSDNQASITIDQRIAQLENRVGDLEKRLALLESSEPSKPETVPPPAPEKKEAKRSPISVTMISKKFHKKDLMAGDAGDRIDFVFRFKSDLEKDVRAFKGVVVIKDLFDQDIMRLTLTLETGIRAGGNADWVGGIKYNQFLAPHQRLLTIEAKDTTVSFELESIIYTDGTRERYA